MLTLNYFAFKTTFFRAIPEKDCYVKKKMAALCDELGDCADDTDQTSGNVSQTCMLISHFKGNAILWHH